MLLFVFPFKTISKKTPANPLVREQMTMQMKPRRGSCAVVFIFMVALLLLSSTRPTPGTMMIKAIHLRRERCLWRRNTEKSAVVRIFIW